MPMFTKSGDRFPGITLPFAGPDFVGTLFHVRQDRVDLRHHILAIDKDRPVRAIAQRDVQHGAVFGDVDFLPGKHLLGHPGHIALDRQLAQQGQGLLVDPVLGIVEKNAFEFEREFFEPVGVLRELVTHGDVLRRGVMCFQVLPGGR